MDMPDDAYPRPRRGRPADLPAVAPPSEPAAPAPSEDPTRDDRVRFAAESLLRGVREKDVLVDLVDQFGVTHAQARRDLRDVRTYAQRALGDEDAIAAFVLRKLGDLERVSEGLLEDATDPLPEEVVDADTGVVTETSLETRIKAKQQRAASARAHADVTKVEFTVVGARSRWYSPRARDASEAEVSDPAQKRALDEFWNAE